MVTGLSWFDREWSTSALGQEQTGWDWFALQLHSGESLMYYQLRRAGQEADPHSGGSWIDAAGHQQRIRSEAMALRELAYWRAKDGTRYPVSWALQWVPAGRRWLVRAVLDDQYMDLAVRYWEGAVDVIDPDSGAVVGQGYLEMTRTEKSGVKKSRVR